MMSERDEVTDGRRLSDRMARAVREMQRQDKPEETYRMATELARANVTGCDAASLSIVRRGGKVENRAATNPDVAWADELQTELNAGPCLEAIEEGGTTYSPSLAYDDRWGPWGPRVVERTGLQSVLSFRLFTQAATIGSLNLYSARKDGFGSDDRHDGLVLASHIAMAVAAADKISHLGVAMASRTVIGQATGIIMERFRVTPEVAFGVLARIAAQEETKIRVLAEELVSTGRLRSHETGGPGEPPAS